MGLFASYNAGFESLIGKSFSTTLVMAYSDLSFPSPPSNHLAQGGTLFSISARTADAGNMPILWAVGTQEGTLVVLWHPGTSEFGISGTHDLFSGPGTLDYFPRSGFYN